MRRIVIMQPYYFAWYGFFEQIKFADIYVFYDDVQYVKRSLMNRVDIKTENGPSWLTIPLNKMHQNYLINQVTCYEESKWRADHLNRLKQTYKNTPFVNEMYNLACDILHNTEERLSDVTITAIRKICHYYNLDRKVEFYLSSELNIEGKSSQRLLNISLALGADVYLTGMGALRYMDFDLFDKAGINVEFIDYALNPYPQLYGNFNPYVSILDLISNTGKEGIKYMTSQPVFYKEFIESKKAKEYLKSF